MNDTSDTNVAPLRIGVIGVDLGRRGELLISACTARGIPVEIVRLDDEATTRPTQITGVWLDEVADISDERWNKMMAIAERMRGPSIDISDIEMSPVERKPKQATRYYAGAAREASRRHSQDARNAMKRGRR